MLGNEDAIKWNTTTISGNLLLNEKMKKWSNIRVKNEFMNYVSNDIKNMWLEKAKDYSGKLSKSVITIDEFDNEIQFAFSSAWST